MSYKLGQIFNFLSLYDRISKKQLPFKTAYKFSMIQKEITNTSKQFYQESMAAILDKYALKDEMGRLVLLDDKQGVKIQQDKYQECMDAIAELNSVDVEFKKIKFDISELQDLNLTLDEIDSLMCLIEVGNGEQD